MIRVIALALFTLVTSAWGQAPQSSSIEQELIELEKKWNAAIQAQDVAAASAFLADGYFLAVGVAGMPVQIAPRERWLENLKFYKIQSASIDDIKVHVYGDVAVVIMMYTQKATVGRAGVNRSAQFFLTDIWVRQKDGWRVAERHSSRPEQPPARGGGRQSGQAR